MNFSNFFIDALSGNDSALTMTSKKNAAPAFMFSDIMKVCEEENSNPLLNQTSSAATQNGNELFSSSDTVINISPEDMTVLTQILASLVQNSGDPQPSKSVYQVDEANITKQQFIITETKLVDLLSEFVEKGNFSIASLANQMQQTDVNKPVTLAFKSGANKLTVAFNPIKIDNNYSASIINDEYSFVNKLIVREGLIQNSLEGLVTEPETKSDSTDKKNVDANTPEEDLNKFDAGSIAVPEAVFFKTEIIEIVNTNPQSSSPAENIVDASKISEYSTSLSSLNKYAALLNQKELNFEQTVQNKTQVTVASELTVNANSSSTKEVTDNKIQIVSSEDTNNTNVNSSIANLFEGLTEEEKSVFKNFTRSGELKQFTYSKETAASTNNSPIIETGNLEKELANALPKEVIANNTVGVKSTAASQQSPIINVVEKEIAQVKVSPEAIKNLSGETNNSSPVEKKNSEENIVPAKTDATPSKITVKGSIKTSAKVEEQSSLKINTETDTINDNDTANTTDKNIIKAALKTVNQPAVDIEQPTKETQSVKTEMFGAKKSVINDNSETTKTVNKSTIDIEQPAKETQFVKTEKVDFKKEEKIEFDLPKVVKSDKNEIASKENNPVREEKSFAPKEAAGDDKNNKFNNAVDVEQTKKSAELVKADSGKMKVDATMVQESGVKINSTDEKISASKDAVENKEIKVTDEKAVKHETKDSKSNTSQENDSSNKSNHESFKSTLASTVTSDFDVEKVKVTTESKPLHESYKTIKPSEIVPEFSKLIQQGEKQTITFQISPENLGKVKLIIDLIQNQIQTKIEVENEQVKQFIQSNVEQLKQNLQASGIQLSNVNISLADYNQKNSAPKVFTPKKKSMLNGEKEIVTEEVTGRTTRKMGYSTYEFLA